MERTWDKTGESEVDRVASDVTNRVPTPDEIVERAYAEGYRRLVGAAQLVLRSPDDAREVVQEAFGRTLERWRRVGSTDDPMSYAWVTMLNLSRSRLRRRGAGDRAHARVDRAPVAGAADGPVIENETRVALAAAIGQLPRRQREVVLLRYYAGYSVDDTARALGISGGSVKSHTHRALKALEGRLEEP